MSLVDGKGKLLSTGAGMSVVKPEPKTDWDFKKQLQHETDYGPDEKQQFTISTNKPLRCKLCASQVDTTSPFLLFATPGGSVFIHGACIGVSTDVDFNDANFYAHLRKRFIDGAMTDKMYGRR